MRILYFKIGNFKSFTDTNNKISDASAINFIYGENNSGKSNVLKFLNIVFSPKIEVEKISIQGRDNQRETEGNFFDGVIDNEPYIYHKNQREKDITFEFKISVLKSDLESTGYEFYEQLKNEYFNNRNNDFKLKFTGRIFSLDQEATSFFEINEGSIEGHQMYQRNVTGNIYFDKKPSLIGNKNAYIQLMAYFNNSVVFIDNNRYFVNEKATTDLGDLTPDNYKNWLYNFSLNAYTYHKYTSLLDFIRSFKIGKLNDIENLDLTFSIDSENNLELMLNKGVDRLPITSFGTGINQLLYILTKIFMSESRILVIEELELNLSPKTQKELFKVFKVLIENRVIDQIFFTSHSPYFNYRNDFSIYEVGINLNKVSSITKKERVQGSFWVNRITD